MKQPALQKIAFGTGGWRGIIGDDFIKANIQRVTYGICLLAKEETTCLTKDEIDAMSQVGKIGFGIPFGSRE